MCRALCKVPEYLNLGFSGSSDQKWALAAACDHHSTLCEWNLGAMCLRAEKKSVSTDPHFPLVKSSLHRAFNCLLLHFQAAREQILNKVPQHAMLLGL